MTKEELTTLFRTRGKQYRHRTSDYHILDEKHGKCSIYIKESGSFEKDPVDWIRNVKAIPTKVNIDKKAVYVHKGFKEAFDELIEVLYPQIHRYKEISIVGYSHGGALGILTYLYLKEHMPLAKINPPVLFGCPMVFSFKKLSGHKHIRKLCKDVITVRYHNDIVARLPGFFLGYGRVGKEIHVKPKRKRLNPVKWIKSFFLDHGEYYNYFKL